MEEFTSTEIIEKTGVLKDREDFQRRLEEEENKEFSDMKDYCTFEANGIAIHVEAKELDARLNQISLGAGQYGTVFCYSAKFAKNSKHANYKFRFAAKRIPIHQGTPNSKRNNELTLRDRRVALASKDCEYTVTYFGSMLYNAQVWIIMELMDVNLYDFYRIAHGNYKEKVR